MKRIIKFLKRLLIELKDPLNIIVYLIVLTLFFSPCIIGYLYTIITSKPQGAAIATAYWLFWAGPFTPAMPIQFAITFAIARPLRRLIRYIQRHSTKWL